MDQRNRWTSLSALLLVFPACISWGSELFDLSLEELTKITVASKREQTLRDAPSTVSVITARDIQRFGAQSLGELVDRLPNTQLIGSNAYPRNHTSMRGVTQTHLDDKILLLMNGRPLRDAGQGGVNADVYATFPLTMIKQIEVIRGPGSVLYGTNAFAGVINIITQSASETPGLELRGRYGSFDTRQWTVTGSATGETGEVNAALMSQRRDGESFNGTWGASNTPPGTYRFGQEATSFALQGRREKFSLNALIDDTQLSNAHSATTSLPEAAWSIRRQFVDLGYDEQLASGWQLKANATYNGLDNKVYRQALSPLYFVTQSRGYLLELQASRAFTDDLVLLLGSSYDKLRGDNLSDGVDLTEIYTHRFSSYGQLDYRANDWLKLSGGLQLNHPQGGDNDLSPRLAALFDLSPDMTLKLMYGKAYRSPFGLDMYVDTNGLKGNPALKPETIETLSAELLYERSDSHYSLAIYQSKHQDLITRERRGSVLYIVNADEMHYEGIEFEFQHALNDRWRLQGNTSYQRNENGDGRHDTTYQPNWMLKSGLAYESPRFTSGVFASYFGQPTALRSLNPAVPERNPEAEAYVMLSANLVLPLDRWLESPALKGSQLEVYANNLLDEEIYYPEFNRQQVNTLPYMEGRAVYLTLSCPLF